MGFQVALECGNTTAQSNVRLSAGKEFQMDGAAIEKAS